MVVVLQYSSKKKKEVGELICIFSLNQLPDDTSVFTILESRTQHVSAFMIGQSHAA